MDAGISAAQSFDGDVHRLWESIVRNTEDALKNALLIAYGEAHEYVYNAMINTHTSPGTSFEFWRFKSTGWEFGTTQTAH